jgi:hypothetical protein
MQLNTVANTGKLWTQIAIWIVVFISLLIINYYYFNRNAIVVFFSIGCLCLPWIFVNKIIRTNYIEKILIKLDYDSFSFTITKNGVVNSYNLCDIKSYYTLIAGTGNSIHLFFKFKNGNKLSFTFPFKKLSEDQTNTDEVIRSFRLMIKDYNKSLNENEHIKIAWWMKGGGN